jgi:hypothetical protein
MPRKLRLQFPVPSLAGQQKSHPLKLALAARLLSAVGETDPPAVEIETSK